MRARLAEGRARTDAIFRLVRPEAMYERPIPERNRIVFYLGHLDSFDWNLLREPLGPRPFDEGLDRLFAFGIDPVDGNLPTDVPSDWPRMPAIESYVRRVRAALDEALARARPDPVLLHVAIEHRLLHAETLAYMLHRLPFESKIPRLPVLPTSDAAPPSVRAVEIPAGRTTLGMSRAAGVFGWDNEFEAHAVDVPAFRIEVHPVTNGRYLPFVEAGAPPPAFWERRDGRWRWRTMFGSVPLPLDWPVYPSHEDAAAFARSVGKTLPTEAQWHRAAHGAPDGTERAFPWGDEPPDATRGSFDFARWDPTPVDAHPAGESAFGVRDLCGNGWEWTRSVFAPFPGFERMPFYPGYSADFFDGRHFVLKGGSALTATCLLRRTFRNWFQAKYPYPYATLRLVEE